MGDRSSVFRLDVSIMFCIEFRGPLADAVLLPTVF